MKQLGGRGSLSCVSTFVMATLMAAACGESNDTPKPQPSGVFGGTGGVVDATPAAGKTSTGGSGGEGGTPPNATCGAVPQGKTALLDDFNDGDSAATPEPGRDAYWFTVHDEADGTLEPAGEFLPSPGGLNGSTAAHIKADGFDIWGASFVANISYEGATRCPYNASGFAGLRFVAKGSGRLRAHISMPEVNEKEFGGTCDPEAGETCYDMHGVFVTLGEEWQVYELPWEVFQQRGFGKQVPFNPATIFSLQFSFETADLPVDVWLDDIGFWDGVPHELGAGGAGGAGGETAVGGQGGEPSFAGQGGEPSFAGQGGAGEK
jgi:hypothetical protein